MSPKSVYVADPHALNVHIDLYNRQLKRSLDREFDAAHDAMRNLGDAHTILNNDVQVNDDIVVVNKPYFDATMGIIFLQENRQPIAQGLGCHANNTVALKNRPGGNSRHCSR
jgi:hypothetical protein